MSRLTYSYGWEGPGTIHKCCCTPIVEVQIKVAHAAASKRGYDAFVAATDTSKERVFCTSSTSGGSSSHVVSEGGNKVSNSTFTLNTCKFSHIAPSTGLVSFDYSSESTSYNKNGSVETRTASNTKHAVGYVTSSGVFVTVTNDSGTTSFVRQGQTEESDVSGALQTPTETKKQWTSSSPTGGASFTRELSEEYSTATLRSFVAAALGEVDLSALPWGSKVTLVDTIEGVGLDEETPAVIYPDGSYYEALRIQQAETIEAASQAQSAASDGVGHAHADVSAFDARRNQALADHRRVWGDLNAVTADLDKAEYELRVWTARRDRGEPGADAEVAGAQARVDAALREWRRINEETPYLGSLDYNYLYSDPETHYEYMRNDRGLLLNAEDRLAFAVAQKSREMWLMSRYGIEDGILQGTARTWTARIESGASAAEAYNSLSENERICAMGKASYRIRVRLEDGIKGGPLPKPARVTVRWQEVRERVEQMGDTLANKEEKRTTQYTPRSVEISLTNGEGFSPEYVLECGDLGTAGILGPTIVDYPFSGGGTVPKKFQEDAGFGRASKPGSPVRGEAWRHAEGPAPHYLTITASGGYSGVPAKSYSGTGRWIREQGGPGTEVTFRWEATSDGDDPGPFLAEFSEPTLVTDTIKEWRREDASGVHWYRLTLTNERSTGDMIQDANTMMNRRLKEGEDVPGIRAAIHFMDAAETVVEFARAKWYFQLNPSEVVTRSIKAIRRVENLDNGSVIDREIVIPLVLQPEDKDKGTSEFLWALHEEPVPERNRRVSLMNFRMDRKMLGVTVTKVE